MVKSTKKGLDMFTTPSHPGETLKDWLDERGLKLKGFSETSDICLADLHRVLLGRQAIDDDMAIKLAKSGCGTVEFWCRRQLFYEHDLEVGQYVAEGMKRIPEFFPGCEIVYENKIDGEVYTRIGVIVKGSVDEAQDQMDKFGEAYGIDLWADSNCKVLFDVEWR